MNREMNKVKSWKPEKNKNMGTFNYPDFLIDHMISDT